ncbi:bifunctional UDP-3-O-[3-hydroxymyristoyl] N-acetylglucosamine deacetylase/3-hydroxyacyl-ACP dehydratase [Bacteroidia bacterium]|jgi:UDP-3-O-[3-hydroxymyristoyl] N-acetylglucosamine deacetylase/3-hydroxyacyl-[acyl-carrier-protein] dehydratase|nr:bifunctional UDP-3-O-[3-hydroxymyristoyl] N-acetylglucosamine deacetylase/3-hydroxyacyl-ACP dehydratase [Bacteroidia bacterium]
MDKFQTTIKEAVTVSGVGLHTGNPVKLTFEPAPEDHGYVFQRVDLDGEPKVKADCDLVVDTSRGTTIEDNGARINTVEHVLAALAGLEIDNCLIKLNAPETPIMDGSSKPFVDMLLATGIETQKKEREYFEIPRRINYSDGEGVEMMALPADDYRLTVMVDYNSPVLGSQHASIVNLSEFKDEISSCRTFCFLHELEMLVKHDLIKGGDLNNAIVIVDRVIEDDEMESLAKLFNKEKIEVKKEGILNNVELRFQNEPARHKLLDMVGDLALAGVPLKAQILAARPGHAANVEFAKKIKKAYIAAKKAKKQDITPVYDQNAVPVFNYQQIASILPHRHPFLLVDKIVKLTDNEVVAVKNITGDQYFFQGHFPGEPLMPGVLQIEAMAQAGGVLVLAGKEHPGNWSTYFVKIENAKFKDKVVPGDTLVIRMSLTGPIRRGLCMMKGEAFVGNRLVSEANMMAQIVENR